MRRGPGIVSVIAPVALLGVAVAMFIYRGEPRYGGNPLSHWLSVSRSTYATYDQREESAAAIRHIGTNGLPLLLKWAAHPDSRIEIAAREFLSNPRTPLVPSALRRWAETPPNRTKAYEAQLGLKILRADAAPAIPILARIATNPASSLETRTWALTALGDIGPHALPALLTIAADPGPRRPIARIIGQFGSNAAPARPTLITWLRDPDVQVRYSSATAMGDIAVEPDTCIPALARCLQTRDSLLRMIATLSIPKFGRAAILQIEAAIARETDPSVRDILSSSLEQLQKLPEASVR